MKKTHNRRLETEQDFAEAMERQMGIRVFSDSYMISSGGIIIQYDGSVVVIQSGVGDLSYLERRTCEFFGIR